MASSCLLQPTLLMITPGGTFSVLTCCGWAQVLYNAQMIRTWSLLLRNAQRLGYIVSGRQVRQHMPSADGYKRWITETHGTS